MKALSVRQPWASLIALGTKTIECRTWRTAYRGKLLICSGSKPDSAAKSFFTEGEPYPLGFALCVVDLYDIRPMTTANLKAACVDKDANEQEIQSALQEFAWHIKVLYEVTPFHVKGRLNLFNIDDGLIKKLDPKYGTHKDYCKAHDLVQATSRPSRTA